MLAVAAVPWPKELTSCSLTLSHWLVGPGVVVTFSPDAANQHFRVTMMDEMPPLASRSDTRMVGQVLSHPFQSMNNSLARCRLQEFAMSSKVNIVVNKYNRLAIMLAKRVLRN
jgi:hypothetical protein